MKGNYATNRVFDAMKRNSGLGRSLALEKKQKAVLDVMIEQKITQDPNKLKGYKKEAFLKAVTEKRDLGYYDRKAFQEVYGEKKIETAKPGIENSGKTFDMKKRYAEIMSKGKSDQRRKTGMNFLGHKESLVQNFGTSDRNMRIAEGLIVKGEKEKHVNTGLSQSEKKEDQNSNVKDILRRIQS